MEQARDCLYSVYGDGDYVLRVFYSFVCWNCSLPFTGLNASFWSIPRSQMEITDWSLDICFKEQPTETQHQKN